MKQLTRVAILLIGVCTVHACADVIDPVHIIDSVENLDRNEITLTYVSDRDTLFTVPLTVDTISSMPFSGEMWIIASWHDKDYLFERIPAIYLNDEGQLSLTRKVFHEEIFPEEWEELTTRGVDYITLIFIANENKQFTIVLSTATGVEIARYFEKLN